MILPLLLALQAAPAAPPAPAKPTPEQVARWAAKLKALGLPEGFEMPADEPAEIHQVTIAPLFDKPFACTEHALGQLTTTGDALGTDCLIVEGAEQRGFNGMFRTDGKTNADWYSWHAEIHAPFDGVVKAVIANAVTNEPGTMGKPPASGILIERADGVNVIYAHVADPRVKKGDHVTAGQVIAIVGNNGMARNPHTHVGAYRGSEPLQIRWDLKAEGKLPAFIGN